MIEGLRFMPGLAPLLVAILAAACVVASVWGARRIGAAAGVAAIRICVLLGIGVLLLGPSLPAPAQDSESRPALAILVDRSRSMCITDEIVDGRTASRFDALRASWLDPHTIERLGRSAEIRLFGVAEELARAQLHDLTAEDPAGLQSRLGDSVNRVIRAGGVSDVLLLTDGADTDHTSDDWIRSAAERAISAGVRIHTVVAGAVGRPDDVALSASIDDPVVSEGASTTLRLRISQSGFDGALARVTVTNASDPGAAPVFDERITLTESRELLIPITPRSDHADPDDALPLIEYTARIEPLPGEVDERNNQASVFVRIARGGIRVLVLENEPYWDTTHFIGAMRADPQVDLTTVIGLGAARERIARYAPEHLRGAVETPTSAPLDERELFDFDIIALGRGVERWLHGEHAELLRRFVIERGGSVIFLRGAPTRAQSDEAASLRRVLADISPVEWGDGVLDDVRLGASPGEAPPGLLDFDALGPIETLLEDLPGMIAGSRIERERSMAAVWLRQRPEGANDAEDPAPAAVAHMQAGRGRTLAVLTDGLWRWSFLPTHLRDYSSVYRLFWGRSVRWLVSGAEFQPGQSVAIDVDPPGAHPGQRIAISVRTRYHTDDNFIERLVVREPSGRERSLAPARADAGAQVFNASFIPEESGVHEIIAATPTEVRTTRFNVREDRRELLDTAARPEALEELATRTGGMFLPLDGAAALMQRLDAATKSMSDRREPVPAWDRWWVFALLIGGLGAEWMWRRWRGWP
ncbi:MAG: hypothetical protein EA376_10625 [Phycisphaeraceae bacterium]|nr:MAG: hypothetical protein EA376_10625 [Phycisphaeraceae bacterium]